MINYFLQILKKRFFFWKFVITHSQPIFLVLTSYFNLVFMWKYIFQIKQKQTLDIITTKYVILAGIGFSFFIFLSVFFDLISLTPEHFFMIIKNFIKGNELSVHQVIENVDFCQMLKKTNLDQFDQKLYEYDNSKLEQFFEKENLKKIINKKKILIEESLSMEEKKILYRIDIIAFFFLIALAGIPFL